MDRLDHSFGFGEEHKNVETNDTWRKNKQELLIQ